MPVDYQRSALKKTCIGVLELVALYRGALFLDRKIRITRTKNAKIPATTRIRVTLSIVAPAFQSNVLFADTALAH